MKVGGEPPPCGGPDYSRGRSAPSRVDSHSPNVSHNKAHLFSSSTHRHDRKGFHDSSPDRRTALRLLSSRSRWHDPGRKVTTQVLAAIGRQVFRPEREPPD